MSMTANEVFLTLRGALARLDKDLSDFMKSQGLDPAPGSQAATERATYIQAESLDTVSAISSMLLESVGEHASLVVKAMTEPINTLACWTCVRSMLESSVIAAWLHDPKIDAHKRVSRAFAHRYEGLEEQVKFGRAANVPTNDLKKLEDLIDTLEQDAVALGFAAVRDRHGKRIGIAERTLSASEMIKIMLNEECAYRALSAVAHAHTWAILPLGFKRHATQSPQSLNGARITMLEKSAGSVEGHAFHVVRAAKALALPVWNQCLYFGWDQAKLTELLESIYDDMKAKPVIRFWR